ncbi:carbon-nitrogen hydrolase family protein [Rubinisphaera italica]|uniref:N-carbamoyl-D-amino acid hydrolase n=1 Tax=Rubinisphaera italica TaxID=2527969 RepID=A0A5C5XI24_9PLAN|nr:carbon-nitrogen hydrolase family protein [Rubinisphaera italica]TWT61805.1 N-carbamoyl-D-amino acid hydrolase [Rubinisphaera italica]
MIKLIGVQCDISLGNCEQNLQKMLSSLKTAADRGANLVIFPECALTGYGFESRETAMECAEPLDGPASAQMIEACQKFNLNCVYGFLEKAGESIFNCAAMVGPEGILSSYRKIHLPFVGVDRFVDYGDRPFEVHESTSLRLGMNICYDLAFPEASRVLAVGGADLIALPTNWPRGAECMTPGPVITRSMENKVYYAAINRIGNEAGTSYIGQSCICGPGGEILAMGSADQEEYLEVDIDVEIPRQKRVIRKAGSFELDRMADRRPEFYQPLINPHVLETPRDRYGASEPE